MARNTVPLNPKSFPIFNDIAPGDENGIIRMIESDWICRPDSANAHWICIYISLATDQYLNTPIIDFQHHIITPLKMAIKHKRCNIVEALIRRFPQVEFDVTSPLSSLAEPVALSVPTDQSPESNVIRDLVATGEFIVSEYYRKMKLMIRNILTRLPPELASLVSLFCTRPQLSKTELVYNPAILLRSLEMV